MEKKPAKLFERHVTWLIDYFDGLYYSVGVRFSRFIALIMPSRGFKSKDLLEFQLIQKEYEFWENNIPYCL